MDPRVCWGDVSFAGVTSRAAGVMSRAAGATWRAMAWADARDRLAQQGLQIVRRYPRGEVQAQGRDRHHAVDAQGVDVGIGL